MIRPGIRKTHPGMTGSIKPVIPTITRNTPVEIRRIFFPGAGPVDFITEPRVIGG